jgi:hypothetical protein
MSPALFNLVIGQDTPRGIMSFVQDVELALENPKASNEKWDELLAVRGADASSLLDVIQIVSVYLPFSFSTLISIVVGQKPYAQAPA